MADSGGFARLPMSSRAVAVEHIRNHGTLSRVELTRLMGLSAPAVSAIVRKLIDDSLVEETGRGESSGGKPRTLLRLNPVARYVVGLHLSFHSITYVLIDFEGDVVARWRRPNPLQGSDPKNVVARIVDQVGDMLEAVDVAWGSVIGLGVAAPGPLARDHGLLSAPPDMAGWAGFELRQALESRLRLPVLLDNDGTAAAAGTRLSTEHSENSVAVLFMSDGIGSGLRTGADVFAGSHGNAGEVGHLCVDVDGPQCWCGAKGCLEAVAGPSAMIRDARGLGLLPETADPSNLASFSLLARLALRGDRRALEIIDRSARYMALGVQAVAAMFDPQLLVLTGPSFAVAGTLYLPAARSRIESSAFGRATGLRVVMDERGFDSAAIGAADIMLRSETAAS